MKPVLIQTLLKKNKGKYKGEPITKEEGERYQNKFLGVVLVLIVVLVTIGFILS
jgi:hypothetical protein